jgi:hypothetical protein
MSYIYSRALVEEYLPGRCSGIDASVPSSGNPTVKPCLWHDKTMAVSRLSRYGMTCKPSTDDLGGELLTSLLEDFRARTLVSREKAQESPENEAECGLTWRGSLARFDLDTSSWKTVQLSLLGDSELSSVTWPVSGMTANGQCWEQTRSVPPINGTGYGLWPTPSGTSNHRKNHVVGRLDEHGGSSNMHRGTEIAGVRCASFEEWMMGWPTGWSGLTALGTDKFHTAQLQHGKC